MLTHRSVGAHCAVVSGAYHMDDESINVVAMPMFHVSGTCWALGGMYGGARTLVMRDMAPDAVLELLERHQATHVFFVPAVHDKLLADPKRARQAMASLRVLGYGGSPMPRPLLDRILATLPNDVYSVYGMTEMSGVVCALGPAEHRDPGRPELLDSAGQLLPGVELGVVEPDTGRDVPVGADGEFWLRSAQCMAGYWGNPEATAETITADGWLRSGDVGYVDAEGYLYLRDRVKDMIISGGENVYAAEVERVLSEHPKVGEVAVIGVPHPKWGETVKAVVVAAPNASVDGDELIAFSRERLAHYKCPTSVTVVDDLPRNPTGKVLKRQLRKDHAAGH
jgi:acyl-CoA synthetase (AMP-forming)/AMP-acid ligase II